MNAGLDDTDTLLHAMELLTRRAYDSSADRVADHFGHVASCPLAPWPPGRTDLAWHLQLAPMDASTIAHAYQLLMDRPGLHAVPAEWLHIELLHAGPVDQYAESELHDIADRVTRACRHTPPVTLTAGRPEIGPRAVTLPLWPGPPLRALWDTARQADIGATNARAALLPLHYAPHLTLAHGADPGAHRQQLRADRADLDVREMTLHVSRLALVAQRHDGQTITWTTLTTVPLAGTDHPRAGQTP